MKDFSNHLMYYVYDAFCQVYWNRKKKEWQENLTFDCYYHTKHEAEEDRVYFVSDDIHVRPLLPYALAA